MTFFRTKRAKQYGIAATVLVLLYAFLTYALVLHIALPGSDFYPHSDTITNTLFNRGFLSFAARMPYFGYHIVALPFFLMGFSVAQASAITCALFNALTAAIVLAFTYRLIDQNVSLLVPLTVSAVTLIVTALWLPVFNFEIYLGQGSPTIWHNPTYYAIKPFALMTVGLYINLDRDSFENTRKWVVFSVLILVGVVMKPVFFQCFFPAVVVVFLLRTFVGSKLSARALVAFIPSIALGCIIAFVLFVKQGGGAEGGGGIALSFFGGWSAYSPNAFVSTILLLAFPLFAMAVNRKEYLSIRGSKFIVFVTLVVAWLEYMLIVETGDRASHGNFGWAICLAAFIAWVYGMISFAKNTIKRDRPWVVLVVGWILVVWHFVSGCCYVYYLFTANVLW